MMFAVPSPVKRKNVDIKTETAMDVEEDDDKPSCSTKRMRRESVKCDSEAFPQRHDDDDERLGRVRTIIAREFNREIKLKEAQLDLVDKRLEEAQNLLHRLRYAIVADYYKKQERTQAMIDAAAAMNAGGGTSLDNKEQQIPLHPSLKKIIGKRPHNLAEIMRACPKREAAKNARNVLSTKSAAERREEQRIKKVIRDKGIVIDHSKSNIKVEPNENQTIHKSQTIKSEERTSSEQLKHSTAAPHVLNNMRTSNKQKIHFAIGNTSKYIGKGEERNNQDSGTKSYTHKWLVYVQMKDIEIPVGKYVKKVRFFLHPSYRPNDVVDIHEPPFQIARRGWGEFPMRIQLFFHECYQQKPLQLVHKVVLDATKSGRQTLGAETIVEVWLRDVETITNDVQQIVKTEDVRNEISTTTTTALTSPTASDIKSNKPRTISLNIKETFDDNFLDFLNKIEESRTSICADIEKIEPTVLVNEALEPQFSNVIRSPYKKDLLRSPFKTAPSPISPSKNMPTRLTPQSQQFTSYNSSINKSPTLPKAIKDAANKLSAAINTSTDTVAKNTNDIAAIPTKSTINNQLISSVPGKIFNSASGTVILPVTKKQIPKPTLNPPKICNSAIFQKKTIKIVNAQGQVKTVQMLIAAPKSTPGNITTSTSTTSSSGIRIAPTKALTTQAQTTNAIAGNLLASKQPELNSMKAETLNAITLQQPCQDNAIKTDNANNEIKPLKTSSSKNIVFQKEGKLYIIDPLQMKLKQQRKNQVSLLKPQVKQKNHHNSTLQSVASDHDYAPPPTLTTTKISKNAYNNRNDSNKAQDVQKWQRAQFERKFNNIEFNSVRSAVEYLLRRLPLVENNKDSLAMAFPFVKSTLQEFHSLPAFKQRCLEWLRAKTISRMLRNSRSLNTENVWSTREIATFARFYGHTPPIKSLQQIQTFNNATIPGTKEHFSALIKTEMGSEQLQLEYDTLSPVDYVKQWIDNTLKRLEKDNQELSRDEIIVIDDDGDGEDESSATKIISKDIVTKRIYGSPLKFESNRKNISYLQPPERLENAFEFVGNICKDISVRLKPEEIIPDVIHPSAQTILAHISQLFIERLLRQTIANQTLNQQEKHSLTNQLPNNSLEHNICSQDLRKTISECSDFDFLTNRSMGVVSHPVKDE